MTGGKKWVLVVTDEQHDWLLMVREKTHLKGSDIVRELISRQMEDDDKKFIASLANAQLKIQLQNINDRKAALAEQERLIRKQFSTSEKVEA